MANVPGEFERFYPSDAVGSTPPDPRELPSMWQAKEGSGVVLHPGMKDHKEKTTSFFNKK